ncbi:hypothetical protein GA0111570_101197 [Raineyella antarctica]|uniref:Neutral zinc metallopeptidase n=1 Tax=Raineyella antarctica TaxID=1577474 RepID=A0A1G6GD77_9ACTN|nr:neutral zinc metallopeptidase [Raineyella antarctica]SDB79924.1 hypothetical protein GA0111570_101197 [Raineyella antarctica]
MKFNENASLDPSRSSSGGGSGGGRIAVGGVGGLILILVALFFGIDPTGILGQSGDTGNTGQNTLQNCTSVKATETNPECRFVVYENSLNNYWAAALQDYHSPKQFTMFNGQIQTGCGTATSAVGPFYCPADESIYLDESFFTTLQQQFGAASTPAVEAYVLAHEYGHHIQNQIGVLDRVQQGGTGAGSPAVRSELQADCFAGVWFANASKDPNGPIAEVSKQDILEARSAAEAIGDDKIQQNTSGRVDRESWTHGSSAQREKWLLAGYTSGDPNKCDTWSARDLG